MLRNLKLRRRPRSRTAPASVQCYSSTSVVSESPLRMRYFPPPFSAFRTALLAALCLPPALLHAQLSSIEIDDEQVGSLPQVFSGQPGPEPTYTTEHVHAVVVSSLDGKPVSRVLVTSGDRRFAAMTDYEGRFSFDYRRIVEPTSASGSQAPNPLFRGLGGLYGGPQTMPVQFQVRKPGYVSNSVMLYLPVSEPNTTQPALQLKIVPAGVITGHVDPDSADPSLRLQVQLHRKFIQNGTATWNTSASSQVNASGEFRFPDLQPGDYKLSTMAWTSPVPQRIAPALVPAPASTPDSVPGLKPAFYPDATDLNSAGLLHIGPGETVTARLAPHSATFYRVVIPIAGAAESADGASVRLMGDSAGLNIGFNSQDHALEGYLPTGSYTADIITFVRTPQNPSPLPVVNGTNMGGLAMIQPRNQTNSSVVAHFEVGSAPLHGAPVTPSPSSEIPVYVHREFTNQNSSGSTGQVFSGSNGRNQRMPPVSLFLQPTEFNFGSNASMAPIQAGDPDDSFKLQNVTEGSYHVNIQSMQGGYVASATCGTTDLLRDPLVVGASGSAAPIVVTLRDDSATVSGTILPGSSTSPQQPTDGGPANPIFIVGIPLDRPQANPLFAGAMTNPTTGLTNFQVGAVPPGHYLFLASNRQLFQEFEYHNPDVLRDLMTKGTPVTISAGEKTDIQVPMMPDSPQSGEGN